MRSKGLEIGTALHRAARFRLRPKLDVFGRRLRSVAACAFLSHILETHWRADGVDRKHEVSDNADDKGEVTGEEDFHM